MSDILGNDPKLASELEPGEKTCSCSEQGYLKPPIQSTPSILPNSRLCEPIADIIHDFGKPPRSLRLIEPTAEYKWASHPMAMVDLPPTESGEARGLILFYNGTFRVFQLKTMKPAGPFRNPHKRSRARALCCLTATTIVSGGWDGTIAVSDAITGEKYCKTKANEGSIVAIDAWDDCIVSVIVSADEERKNLKFFRFKDGKIQVVSEVRLEYDPLVLKIVKIDNKLQALVAFRITSSLPHLYTMDGCLELLDVSGGRSNEAFLIEDVALNEARTRYAALLSYKDAVSYDRYMRITTGSFDSIITKTYFSCGNFCRSKIVWSQNDSALYVSDNFGRVRAMPLQGSARGQISAHKGALQFLHVCHSDREMYLHTGGINGKVFLW